MSIAVERSRMAISSQTGRLGASYRSGKTVHSLRVKSYAAYGLISLISVEPGLT